MTTRDIRFIRRTSVPSRAKAPIAAQCNREQADGEGPGPRCETVKRDRHRNLLFTVGLSQIPSSALRHARRARASAVATLLPRVCAVACTRDAATIGRRCFLILCLELLKIFQRLFIVFTCPGQVRPRVICDPSASALSLFMRVRWETLLNIDIDQYHYAWWIIFWEILGRSFQKDTFMNFLLYLNKI